MYETAESRYNRRSYCQPRTRSNRVGYVYATYLRHPETDETLVYVGKHVATEFDVTYRGSGLRLRRFLAKYPEALRRTRRLMWCYSQDELDFAEMSLIEAARSIPKYQCLNIALGGNGGPMPKSALRKISKANRGIPKTAIHNARNSAAQRGVPKPNAAKPRSMAGRRALTIANRDPDKRARASATLRAIPRTTCKHCGRAFDPGNYAQYHGDNCSANPDVTPESLASRVRSKGRQGPWPKKPCKHCGRLVAVNAIRSHESACRQKNR